MVVAAPLRLEFQHAGQFVGRVLWLGPAPERPFHEVYFPGPKWYRWWDFANGTHDVDLLSAGLQVKF